MWFLSLQVLVAALLYASSCPAPIAAQAAPVASPATAEAGPQDGSTAAPATPCDPACRGAFACVRGRCQSACGGPCPTGQHCDGQSSSCQAGAVRPRIISSAVRQAAASPARPGTGPTDLHQRRRRRRQATRRARRPASHALLVNPLAAVSSALLLEVYGLPVDFQWIAVPHLALDLRLTPLFFADEFGLGGEGGLRWLPTGSGHDGLFLGCRGGGFVVFGAGGAPMVTAELGYAFRLRSGWAFDLGVEGGTVEEQALVALNFGIGGAW